MNAVVRPNTSCTAQELSFEPVELADVDEISAIEQTVYSFPWTHGNFLDSLASSYSLWKLVNPYTREIAAYAVVMFAVDEAHLLNISVARAWQGQGVGKRLLRLLMSLVQERHMRGMLLEVRPSNERGIRLYTQAGFEKIGVRKGYYPAADGREDASVLWKTLNP